MKRVLALILCVILVVACIVPVSAAGYVSTVTYSCRAHSFLGDDKHDILE